MPESPGDSLVKQYSTAQIVLFTSCCVLAGCFLTSVAFIVIWQCTRFRQPSAAAATGDCPHSPLSPDVPRRGHSEYLERSPNADHEKEPIFRSISDTAANPGIMMLSTPKPKQFKMEHNMDIPYDRFSRSSRYSPAAITNIPSTAYTEVSSGIFFHSNKDLASVES